ncbi:MAG: ABC transporter permease [Bacteroidales bacterium]|nr:ABC transporter permease [Bacteroidales bacterium]MCF8405124.1 ABC transporter permease [Bacteroidales bacterium]
MLKNYIIVALRNIYRQKVYSIINILGLAIGFAAFILIVLHINHELSYDKFHDKADRIYRVCVNGMVAGDPLNVAVSAAPTGEAMVREIPTITTFTRIDKFPQSVHLSYNERNFYQEGLIFADSTFFDLFSFKLIQGNPKKALTEPYSLVLTKSVADKYFGNEDPMGKVIKMNNNANFTITGIVEDPPTNSHFSFEAISSFTTMLKMNGPDAYKNWGSLSLYTYVLLANGASAEETETRFPDLYLKYMEDLSHLENISFTPYLQPLTSIHLHSNLMAELEPNSDIDYVYAFLAIALFILLIACINFMNLATARSVKRAKEVGLRKVVGAYKKQLVFQFLGEALLLSFFALILSIILIEIFLPTFNHLLDKTLEINIFSNLKSISYLLGLVVVVGILAGSYPAFYLSSFQPVKVLKGTFRMGSGKSGLRNILVIIQFSISIFLIICTSFVYNQLNYLRQSKLGFNKEQVVVIPLRGERLFSKADLIKSEFNNLSVVKDVTSSRFVPGRDMDGSGFIPEGYDENNPIIIFNNQVDFSYIETMEMNILSGRSFSKEFSTDSLSVVINETLVKKLGWEEPLGKKITGFGRDKPFDLTVIGIVEDYHFRSLHDVIEPSLMFVGNNNNRFISVRLNSGDIKYNIEMLKDKWKEIESTMPFDYYFLDEDYDNLYKAEQRVGEIFIYFTVIAIVIACLGLFGLASYNAEQKTREIGIRKALGSSVNRILIMLSKQFSKWVLIANIIAWPVSWYFISEWLGNFAYSIKIVDKWWIFLLSAGIAFIIALLTVTYQTIKAAIINPVDAIKYE